MVIGSSKLLKTSAEKSASKIFLPPPSRLPEGLEGIDAITTLLSHLKDIDCLSIDIGVRNFAIRREIRSRDGSITPKLFQKMDFAGEKESGSPSMNPDVLLRANGFLSGILNRHISQCNLIVIERQMAQSPKNRSMFDLVINFLLSRHISLLHGCVICDINPKIKGKIMGAGRRMSSHELKKWSIDEAERLLMERDDEWSLEWLHYHRDTKGTKADDLADTILQLEALMRCMESKRP